ncbi:MAG: hypothetical protein M1491_03140 [Deltaproteobacteria bacterium]|nr:hypothetical protein [Deltaproteobacteria bacterium]
MKNKSITEIVYETVKDLYSINLVDQKTMSDLNNLIKERIKNAKKGGEKRGLKNRFAASL